MKTTFQSFCTLQLALSQIHLRPSSRKDSRKGSCSSGLWTDSISELGTDQPELWTGSPLHFPSLSYSKRQQVFKTEGSRILLGCEHGKYQKLKWLIRSSLCCTMSWSKGLGFFFNFTFSTNEGHEHHPADTHVSVSHVAGVHHALWTAHRFTTSSTATLAV